MVKFSVTHVKKSGAAISSLKINGNFIKYIQNAALPVLQHDLNEWLSGQPSVEASHITIEDGVEYEFSFETEASEQFIELLITGSGKKQLKLPAELSHSHQKSLPIVLAYRDLSLFKDYFLSPSRETRYSLYEVLSQDLIEVPYLDDPEEGVLTCQNKIVFHVNHGTTHAMRQTELSRHYFNLVKMYGNAASKLVANDVTSEEYACLELAAFLFRSGRTNELSWSEDPLYGKRSAAIFNEIALALDFNADLVQLITLNCFDYHAPLQLAVNLPHHTSQESQDKIVLFRKILKLSHESDLMRCYTKYEEIKNPIVDELTLLLDTSRDLNEIADDFLSYAVMICKKTGSSVAAALDKKEICIANKAIAVDAATRPKLFFYKLLGAMPALFPQWGSPTQMWIQSDEHVTADGSGFLIKAHNSNGQEIEVRNGWGRAEIDAIPTQQCIEVEEQNVSTHVTVYHATTKASYALDLICRSLKKLSGDQESVAWVRDFHSQPRVAYSDVESMKSKLSQHYEVDNKENTAWHLLACNPTLWHNADYDSQESSVDYYYLNTSVLHLDFKGLINTFLDRAGVMMGSETERERFIERFYKLINDKETYGNQGVIYQYAIPFHLVGSLAFISGKNGVVDQKNPSALETLLRLKTPGCRVPNHNQFQVRLFVPKLLDETFAREIIVTNYFSNNKDVCQAFEDECEALARIVYSTQPTPVLKEKQPVVENSYQFTAFDGYTKRYATMECQPKPKARQEQADSAEEFSLFSDWIPGICD